MPNKNCPEKKTWEYDLNSEISYQWILHRGDEGFCTDAYFVISVRTIYQKKRIQNFIIYAVYNSNLLLLPNAYKKSAIAQSLTEGIYFYYNGTDSDIDSDYRITIQNNGQETLSCHVSVTVRKSNSIL